MRNNVGEVLRRASAGETFVVTVAGRPTATVGPLGRPAGPALGEDLHGILRDMPVDTGWAEDLRRMREEDRKAAEDPWRG